MWFKLALEVYHMPPAYLRQHMSYKEYAVWAAYFKTEESRQSKEDVRTALICATIASTFSKSGQDINKYLKILDWKRNRKQTHTSGDAIQQAIERFAGSIPEKE